MAALLVAKVVLITDALPFVNRFPEKPLIYNVVWKTALPAGNSSPVLTKDRIFITGYEPGGLLTMCLNRADGKVLWRRTLSPARTVSS